jgi:hypothetical protein
MIKGAYKILNKLEEDSDRFFAGTCLIRLFPGISMINKHGALTWCHHVIVAVTPKAVDHKKPETIMFFANKDGTMHFKSREWLGSKVDNYETSEIKGSRLRGKMDVHECLARYLHPEDKIRYKEVQDIEEAINEIINNHPEFAAEHHEDCENIHEIASLIDILTTIGWTKLYSETAGRLWCFRDAFRSYYNYSDISDYDLNKAIVYSFGVFGQGEVYNIYTTAVKNLEQDQTLGQAFTDFVEAFKEVLDPEEFEKMKPQHFIELFIEYIYSIFIKR